MVVKSSDYQKMCMSHRYKVMANTKKKYIQNIKTAW